MTLFLPFRFTKQTALCLSRLANVTDLPSPNQQFSSSLAQHRKKTGRDLALLQEMMLQMMHTFYMYNSPLAETDLKAADAQAKVRLNNFMEDIVRGMSELKPITDKLEEED